MKIGHKTVVIMQENKRLDEIVFEEYGHLNYLEEVLERNIEAIGYDVFLPQGIEIMLPFYVKENVKEVEASTLW